MVAVVIAVVAYMIIGVIWYAPGVFGKTWMRLLRFKEKDVRKGMANKYVGSVISGLVLALVLASFMGLAKAEGVANGVLVGLLSWVGFVATTSFITAIYENRPAGLYFIDAGYHLVSMVVMGAIIGAFA